MTKKKIYVASSWRNLLQASVVEKLRDLGHEVYDFKHPEHGNSGFHWSDIDGGWENWSIQRYREALLSPIAELGFNFDHTAMLWADTCVLVLPSGRSAHLEAGWLAGQGKSTIVFTLDEHTEPELMYKEFSKPYIVNTFDELFYWVENERTP